MKVKCTKCDFVLDETPWTTASERKFESHECLSEFDKGRKQGALEELRKEKRLLKKIINLDLNDNENNVSPEICKLIEDELKRIKELEGELNL